MRLICIEEHAVDREILAAALPELQIEAPYMALQNSTRTSTARGGPYDRPQVVEMDEAVALGTELGRPRIEVMDRYGIDVQVVSYSTPIQLAPPERAVELARRANDRLAAATAAYPDRLGAFALLPWQHPRAAAEELARCLDELGMRGALIVGRPGPTFLDDPRYDVVLDTLDTRGVPLYLHPFHPVPAVQAAYYAGLPDDVTAQLSLGAWGWHNEAGVHLLRLLLSGAFERHPGLQVISGHWGELVPYFLPRLDDAIPRSASGLSTSITETYRNHVWITPSGMYYPAHLDFIRSTIGLERLIWAVDYPYLTLDGTREFIDSADLTDTERHRITHGNAEALLKL